jgi:hypothetical protein
MGPVRESPKHPIQLAAYLYHLTSRFAGNLGKNTPVSSAGYNLAMYGAHELPQLRQAGVFPVRYFGGIGPITKIVLSEGSCSPNVRAPQSSFFGARISGKFCTHSR